MKYQAILNQAMPLDSEDKPLGSEHHLPTQRGTKRVSRRYLPLITISQLKYNEGVLQTPRMLVT